MAKRRYEQIKLNGKNFKLDTQGYYETVPTIPYRSVNDVYVRCSDTKKSIFNEWCQWFTNHGGYCGVAFYNDSFFSITGVVEDEETGKSYYCYITYANNNCIEIKNR